MLTINELNRFQLLLSGANFFEFEKYGEYNTQLFIKFEAERFCFLFNESLSVATSTIIQKAIDNYQRAYSVSGRELWYDPKHLKIGKFIYTGRKSIHSARFLAVLNTKTNFFYADGAISNK